jgi:hypothetical protein
MHNSTGRQGVTNLSTRFLPVDVRSLGNKTRAHASMLSMTTSNRVSLTSIFRFRECKFTPRDVQQTLAVSAGRPVGPAGRVLHEGQAGNR